jgi:ferritin-like metal-binding protein YciE
MSLFTNLEFNSLDDLFLNQLEDLYDAENRIVKALPKMVETAVNPDLKAAFSSHLRQTEGHVQRLESIFNQLGKEPKRETCEAMKGLLREAEEMLSAKGDPEVRDAALIAAAQRVEHYEMSGYGSARTFALQLGQHSIARILQTTLEEEAAADKKLTQVAEAEVNIRASR